MATNQVIYDQIYRVIEAVRSEVRLNYDHGKEETNKRVCFKRTSLLKAVRIDEDDWIGDASAMGCIVSWDDNNETLRNTARTVMDNIC